MITLYQPLKMINSILSYLKTVKSYYRRFIRRRKSIYTTMEWRKKNKHNFTFPANGVDDPIFPINKIKVGNGTYGSLFVVSYGKDDGNLIIGHYCSIANSVKFLIGGGHNFKSLSTYPFKFFFANQRQGEDISKGDIVIGDDVWIGDRAIVLSGVKIGRGAVIGAGCVVTKDVNPYEIVIGNPMRVLKKRFPDNIIEQLMKMDFSKLDLHYIQSHIDLLYQELDEHNINEFNDLI